MDHFTNIKVKGVTDEGGRKNYIIKNTDDGSEHIAIKRESGSKYDIGEHTCLTLRQFSARFLSVRTVSNTLLTVARMLRLPP